MPLNFSQLFDNSMTFCILIKNIHFADRYRITKGEESHYNYTVYITKQYMYEWVCGCVYQCIKWDKGN